MEWINVGDRLPIIELENSRVQLPLYVELEDGRITIADYTKSKFTYNIEWVSLDFEPIWICRERGEDISGSQLHPVKWMPLPEPPTI